MFHSRTSSGLCLAWLERQDGEHWVEVYHFAPSSGADGGTDVPPTSWRSTPALLRKDMEQITARCGDLTRTFLELTIATCHEPESLEPLLRAPRIFAFEPPSLDPKLQALSFRKVERHFFQAADDIGCARVVTSSDRRARVWIPRYERITEAPSRAVQRGIAWIQWIDASQQLQAYRDGTGRQDLHLDTIVDAIEPLPGTPNVFIILGLRSYLTPFAGETPRRYAQVVRLSTQGGKLERISDAFLLGQQRRPALLLQAPVPETGKFRHSELATQWLRFDPSSRAITLEGLPGSLHASASPAVVARWNGKAFVVSGRKWGAIRRVERW